MHLVTLSGTDDDWPHVTSIEPAVHPLPTATWQQTYLKFVVTSSA
jgi:hypothetical protein